MRSRAEYPNENDSQYTEVNKIATIPNFMPQMMKLQAKGINSLNPTQGEVFNVVHKSANDYMKYDEHDVDSVHPAVEGQENLIW